MPKTRRGRRPNASRATDRVPYARGFRQPTEKKCLSAVGNVANEKFFALGGNFFPPLPPPSSIDDWLAQYNEEGQTYAQFVTDCPWLSTRKWKYAKSEFNPRGKHIGEKYPGSKIYLQPLGNFNGTTSPNFDDLAEYARLFFCLPVEILPGVDLEVTKDSVCWIESAAMRSGIDRDAKRKSSRSSKCQLDLRWSEKSAHIQLNCRSLLACLRRSIPDDALCLIGLTMFDLYDSDPDLFVAGLAAGNQRVGVFSFFRYNPTLHFSTEFWYNIKKSGRLATEESKKIVFHRSCKLLVHEISHLFGIDHCIWFSCCMNGSGHLEEDFRQSMHLCPVDLHKLQTLCGFDVVERYSELEKCFNRCGLRAEADWVKKRIAFLA